MKYEYFISYCFERGAGNARIILEGKINKFEDVKEIEKMITENIKAEKVIITNFELMRKLGGWNGTKTNF